MLKLILILLLVLGAGFLYFSPNISEEVVAPVTETISEKIPLPSPTPSPITYPDSHIIPLRTHTFQSFNNCGPSALSMTLSYFDINQTQVEIGQVLRPYQIPGGDNDDKSVTLDELAAYAQNIGLLTYHRPNGSEKLLKAFISNDIPVITRTWLKPNDDIGHYRVVRGYTENSLIQDDSLQNKNLSYNFSDFDLIWKKFNYEYLVLVPREKQKLAEQILQGNLDEKVAWGHARDISLDQLRENPNDIDARFNLSIAYYHLGEYQKSVDEYEKVENRLPFRTLWYQIEPVLSYRKLGNNQKVLEIIEKTLNYHNRAYSELYHLRGQIYEEQLNPAAEEEFRKAEFYNSTKSYLVNLN